MTESHIQATELAKSYGDVRALDGLSLEIAAGSVFALLGPNGAGKSTTVKILSTLSRPDSGSARVAGFDVLREPERVRGAIGLVGQKASSDPLATARENLVLAGLIQGMPHAAAARATSCWSASSCPTASPRRSRAGWRASWTSRSA